ncbi:MAG: sigma-70 family RNA polymerase sigma factor [Steroidobacteraceae bacterium]
MTPRNSVDGREHGTVGGNEESARTLESHRKYLMRYALFHLRESSLAEDAVQDTLIAALAQHDAFEGRSQLRTWLTSILKHKIIDLVRKRGRGLPVDVLQLGEEDGPAGNSFNASGRWVDPPADWGLPDAAFESKQFWRVYQKCCQRMPERHALVFSMREVMDLSTEEICKKLQISKSNLHVILYRARLSLRSCMTENWFAGDHA